MQIKATSELPHKRSATNHQLPSDSPNIVNNLLMNHKQCLLKQIDLQIDAQPCIEVLKQ